MAPVQKSELLELDINTYNAAFWLTWYKNRPQTTPSTTFKARVCRFCGRFYDFSCICPEGEAIWEKVLQEVRDVSEMLEKGEW